MQCNSPSQKNTQNGGFRLKKCPSFVFVIAYYFSFKRYEPGILLFFIAFLFIFLRRTTQIGDWTGINLLCTCPSQDSTVIDPRRSYEYADLCESIFFFKYSRTSRYGHLSKTDTSISRTVFNAPTKFSYIFFKKNSL